MKARKFTISSGDKKLIALVLAKIREKKKTGKLRIFGFESLYRLLDKNEINLIKKLLLIEPLKYGFKGKYLGLAGVPNDLVAIRTQKYKFEGKTKSTGEQYLPKQVFLAYKKLNSALYKDTGKKLLVGSGYRSPAYQVITFLWHLNFHKFNFNKTIKRVAIPGYSEHGFARWQAIDFMTDDGIPTVHKPADFAKTVEYKWLLENANRFGFYQSYPRNNKLGVAFEPWHWQFRKLPLLPV